MRAIDVNQKTELKLWAQQYLKNNRKKKTKKPFYQYNVGDYARLSYLTNVFTRDFDQKWTSEIFKIVRRYPRHG